MPLPKLAASFLLASALLYGCGSTPAPVSSPAPVPARSASPAFTGLEHRYGARLGVYVLDTGTGRTVTYRADERFAHASTFKALAAGVVLRSGADLDHVIKYRAKDLQEYAPITSKHVTTGMRLRDVIAAALEYSDNTAANLLLDRIGGPPGLQKALRALGDRTTHADRPEPAVNETRPGDIRDTSTPRALGTDLRNFVLGDLLPAERRDLMRTWLLANTTGAHFIRAGVPSGWKIGDKTGNGAYGTRNDIAIAWPPSGNPLVIAVQSDRGRANAPSDDALIADATRMALAALR
jgi:beta-lactamase class A